MRHCLRTGSVRVRTALTFTLALGTLGPLSAGDRSPDVQPLWMDSEGRPLPFATAAEVESFLGTATVISSKELKSGRTRPLKLLLERDGVRAHAIFRHVDRRMRRPELGDGRRYVELHDGYANDLAAYALDSLMEFHRMPPTVARSVDGRAGSVQLWVEGATTERKRREREGIESPDPVAHQRQLQMMNVFDALIANVDRNLGNMLYDGSGRLLFIDHTRSFVRHQPLGFFDTGLGIERRVWERLSGLQDDEIRARLTHYVGVWQIEDLLDRRRAIVEAFAVAIADQGPVNAFF
jgi:hypothetical protein